VLWAYTCCSAAFAAPHAAVNGSIQDENLSTMQTFDMKRSQPLPPLLLPYLRLAYATTHEQLEKVRCTQHANDGP
jgi:hypothetical protein